VLGPIIRLTPEMSFPPSDTVIPIVVVNRVTGDVAIELTPSG
jgi:hypothetical protein